MTLALETQTLIRDLLDYFSDDVPLVVPPLLFMIDRAKEEAFFLKLKGAIEKNLGRVEIAEDWHADRFHIAIKSSAIAIDPQIASLSCHKLYDAPWLLLWDPFQYDSNPQLKKELWNLLKIKFSTASPQSFSI